MSQLWDRLYAAFHQPETQIYRWVQGIVWAAIALSIALFFIDLEWERQGVALPVWLAQADWVLLAFFWVEIGLRVLTYRPAIVSFLHPSKVSFLRHHVAERVRFVFQPLNLIDVLAVLAVWPAFRGLRALRLLRLLRTLRIFRYGHPLQGVEQSFRDNRLLYGFAFAILGGCIALGGLSLYLIEHRDNDQINTISDGLWWAIVTLTTVGYGDVTPNTGLGRIVAGSLMIAGMFMLALFAGIVGHTLLNAVLSVRQETMRMSGYVNHVVVCGYNPGARMLLDALLEESRADGQELIIFARGERLPDIPASFMWVSGDPTKESELDKVRLAYAGAVIIVGSRAISPQHADANTILTLFTVRSYMSKQDTDTHRRKPLYLVAEILDSENVVHARTAGADEVIETTRLGFSLLSHAITMPGTAAVMSKVAAAGAHSLYVGDIPASWDLPQPFFEVSRRVKRDFNALVIGVRHTATGPDQVNPPEDMPIEREIQLLYLASEAVMDATRNPSSS